MENRNTPQYTFVQLGKNWIRIDLQRISHFELYLEAMAQIGASRKSIDELLEKLMAGVPLHEAIANSSIPEHAQHFLIMVWQEIM